MLCFNNLIGIKGTCGEQTLPDSGLFLQDLPLINIPVYDKAIGSDVVSAYDQLARKLELAQTLVVNELQIAISSKFKVLTEIENAKVGFIRDNLETLAAQAKYIGANIESSVSRYAEIFISRVGVHMQASGAVSLLVIDLNSGTTLDTISITAVANVPTYLDINKKYRSNGQKMNLFIGYDATTKASYKTLIHPNWCRTCNGSWYVNSYSRIRAVTIGIADSKIDQNLTSTDSTGGVIVDYSIGCDIERYACSVKHHLAQPIWYRTGVLVLDEMVTTQRFNTISLQTESIEQARTYYQGYYDTALKWAIRGLAIPKDYCFICQPRAKVETVLP